MRPKLERIARASVTLAAAALPGALAGAQLGLILFFLNPDLPFDAFFLARTLGEMALLLGLPCAAVLLAYFRGNGRRIRQFLPYGVMVALAISALGFWVHPQYFASFLPPGIVSRLYKAAVSIALAALVCFYTVVWSRWRRRRFGWISQTLVLAMAAFSLSVVVERREAFKPQAESFRQTLFESRQRPFLAVVGLDGASLEAILPLTEKGRLPFFSQILEQGARVRVATLEPPRRAALWSTLATGKLPYKHGIVGDKVYQARFFDRQAEIGLLPVALFFEHWAPGLLHRPADSRDLQMLPIWRMLARLGVPAAVVDWPLTAPIAVDGTVTVSDGFFAALAEPGQAPDALPAAISSAELGRRAALFQVREDSLDSAVTQRFGPAASLPADLRRALAADVWREDFVTFMTNPDLELEALFVRLPGLRTASTAYRHDFAAAPFEGEPASSTDAHYLASYYGHLDSFLARLWASRQGPRWLVVVAPQGAAEDSPRAQALRALAPTGDFFGYGDGLFLFLGEGIAPGAAVRRASLADLVPTLLYGLGFPIARDFDGNVLSPIFQTGFVARQPLTFVPSYETLAVSRSAEGNGVARSLNP